jgi:cell pole-organizing protein PopZ
MTRKTLDPNLASILDSIRATVGGEGPPPAEAVAEPAADPTELAEAEADAAPEPAPKAGRGARKAAQAAPAPAAPAPAAPAGKGGAALAVPSGSRTVEEFLAELIRPQVDAWLKANLPELIQKMAADEIARLTGRR